MYHRTGTKSKRNTSVAGAGNGMLKRVEQREEKSLLTS